MTETMPAASAEDLAEEAWGHLAMHPDPVLRYQAINHLTNRLGALRAITAKQAEVELGGVGQAAEALGISRQAVTEMYGKADVPGPRNVSTVADRPAFRYGHWLRRIGIVAEAAQRRRQYNKLRVTASRTTALYPAAMRHLDEWLASVARLQPSYADELRAGVPDVAEVVEVLGLRHLTLAEQGDVVLGLHHR